MSTNPPPRRPAVYTPWSRRFTDERALDLSAAMQLHEEVHTRWRKSQYAKPIIFDAFASVVLDHIEAHASLPTDPKLREALVNAIKKVVALEDTIFTSPEIDWSRAHLSLKEQVDLRRFLRAQEHFLANEDRVLELLINAVAAMFIPIVRAMPKGEPGVSATFGTNLIDQVEKPAEVLETVLGAIATQQVLDAGLFIQLFDRCHRNACSFSGIPPDDDSRKPIILPTEAKLAPAELAVTYFDNTPILPLLRAPVPFELTARFSHQHVVATPGAGKTNLIGVLLSKDFDEVARGAASVIVLDSQGDLINSIVRIKDFAPGGRLHDRLVYIDPTDIEYPLQLNFFGRSRSRTLSPLEKRTEHSDLVDLLLFLFGALKQEATGRQETLVKAVASLIQEIPDATLMTLNAIFEPGDKKKPPLETFTPYLARLDRAVQEFFAVDFNGSEFSQTRAQMRARVQSLITDPVFRAMFTATTQKLDFASEMNAGKVILINAYEDLLKTGTEVFGRFFIALAGQATQARQNMPEGKRMPTYFYIDECYKFIKDDTNMEKILDTGRKYRLGVILAHQRLNQLSDALRSAASSAAIKMFRAPVYEDAGTLAKQLNTSPEFFDDLPRHAFATRITGMRKPLALTVPLSPLASIEHMTDAEFAEVRNVMRRKYAGTPSPDPITEPSAPETTASAASERTSSPNTTASSPEAGPSSDIELVIIASRKIETLLVTRCGATGSGLHAKLDAVANKLTPLLLERGHYIATMRNKTLHVDGFFLPDREQFLEAVRSFDAHFADASDQDFIKPGKDWGGQ